MISVDNGVETTVDLEWLKGCMKKAIRPVANRHSAYAAKTREWIYALDHGGIRAIPRVREELKTFFGAREQGAAKCFRTWDYWLGMISMATPKSRAQVKPDLYAENFNRIFGG